MMTHNLIISVLVGAIIFLLYKISHLEDDLYDVKSQIEELKPKKEGEQ